MKKNGKKNVTRLELINRIKEKGFATKDAQNVLNIVLETFKETFSAKANITLRGFGTFSVVERKEHPARNPRTGEQVIAPARNSIKFIPSDELKKLVNS